MKLSQIDIKNDCILFANNAWDTLEWLEDKGYLNKNGKRLKHRYWLMYVKGK